MKTINIYIIILILPFISLPIMAQTSQVIYNNPEHTSGSLTLSATDCQYNGWYWGWEINIPANTPITLSTTLNIDAYLQIYTNESGNSNYIYDDYGPASMTSTVISTIGKIYVYAEDDGSPVPSNGVFTINFSLDNSYTVNQNTYASGDAVVGQDLEVKGSTTIEGRLGIGSPTYSGFKVRLYNNTETYTLFNYTYKSSTSPIYGYYSNAYNPSGNVYGIYSSVGGVTGKKWAGYFAGGDVEVTGGNIFNNSENSVISTMDDNIGLVKKYGISGVWAVGSNYYHRFGKWSTSTLKGNVSSGTFTEQMRIANNGNVGIGTTTPGYKLDVAGDIQLNGRLGTGLSDAFTYDNKTMGHYSLGWFSDTWTNQGPTLWQSAWGGMKFFTLGQPRLSINANGNVSIGTTDADPTGALLTVNGKIHAKEVIIDMNAPMVPDYVFQPTYNLMPLNKVEQFVKTNNHLPEIPSAEEVQKKGLSMGEMQNKLLQKIEELTLYVIEQQKRIEQLEKNQK